MRHWDRGEAIRREAERIDAGLAHFEAVKAQHDRISASVRRDELGRTTAPTGTDVPRSPLRLNLWARLRARFGRRPGWADEERERMEGRG